MVVTKPKKALVIKKFMLTWVTQAVLQLNAAKTGNVDTDELLSLASLEHIGKNLDANQKTDKSVLMQLGAAAQQNVCPIETRLGKNLITVNWRGVNIQNASVKTVYENKFTEALPRTIENWAANGNNCENLIQKMRELKVYMRDTSMVKLFDQKWTTHDKLIMLETFFSYLEAKQRRCGISEELISAIQQRTLEALRLLPKDAVTSFETCPWELCRSENGTSSVMLLIKAALSGIGLCILVTVGMRYRSNIIKNKVMDQIDIEVPIKERDMKQKLVETARITGQIAIVVCNLILVLVPAKWTQELVCNLKI